VSQSDNFLSTILLGYSLSETDMAMMFMMVMMVMMVMLVMMAMTNASRAIVGLVSVSFFLPETHQTTWQNFGKNMNNRYFLEMEREAEEVEGEKEERRREGRPWRLLCSGR